MRNWCSSGLLAAAVLTLCWGGTVVGVSSCGSSSGTVQTLTAEERYDLAKRKFDDHDYTEAISEFEIVRLQFPGSSVADKAQYYLAESHFNQEEYLLAAEEYQALKRNMPASPLIPLAQYKIGLCYYNLSPTLDLDQSYAARAIDELQTFIEYNPSHELVKDAEAKIQELNARLAGKLFDAAQLYMKMEYYKAATLYFNDVTEKYHDSPYAAPALLGKVRALIARKRYDEAKPEIDKFLDRYPASGLRGEAESLQRDIDDHMKSKSALVSPGEIPRFPNCT